MCIFVYILEGLRPMPPTRTLNASRPPDRLGDVRGPRHQRRDQSAKLRIEAVVFCGYVFLRNVLARVLTWHLPEDKLKLSGGLRLRVLAKCSG